MKPTTFNINLISSLILLLLWTYTGLDKLLNWQKSWGAFHNQTFPGELAEVLAYAVPIAELLVAGLLLFSATNWWGFLGSVLLLTVFNTYVGLIWAGAFPRVPCSCAGLMDQLGWAEHFWLNMLLTVIAVTGLLRSRPNPAITANH
jgi:uncharacterized membrane protein YphA (DoxX/SURF4 family)